MSDLDETEAAEQKAADEAVLKESRKHTRRSFAIAAAAAAAGWGVYEWIDNSQRLSMQPKPFRRVFQANAKLSRTIFDERALAPTYPLKRAEELRVNGVYGLKQEWFRRVGACSWPARPTRKAIRNMSRTSRPGNISMAM